ncbi:MAG TPA: hypothetical protein VE955_07275 [Candidatus Dormibacteraeota bacterium]|jgi:hypothetical protein|nr:hypothetical protein [Candidatus Dormibacteraeota bacterium]
MAKLRDRPVKISFKDTPHVVVEYDPNLDEVEREGRNGPYPLAPVKLYALDDVDFKTPRTALLPIGSNRLYSKLPVDKLHTVDIQMTGTGMDTDYQVKILK